MNIIKTLYTIIVNLFKFEDGGIVPQNVEKKPLVTLKDYLTSSGKYPERENHKEVTSLVISNATLLLEKVNGLLIELKVESVKVSSGFRPTSVNSKVVGAAKKSKHCTGDSVDFLDRTGKLDELFITNQPLLEKYGLYLEHPDATPNWSHLGQVSPKSGRRVFYP